MPCEVDRSTGYLSGDQNKISDTASLSKIGTDLNPRIKYNALFDLVKNTSVFFSVEDPGITCSSPTSCTTTLIQDPNAPLFFALRGIGSTKEDGSTAWQMA